MHCFQHHTATCIAGVLHTELPGEVPQHHWVLQQWTVPLPAGLDRLASIAFALEAARSALVAMSCKLAAVLGWHFDCGITRS